MPTITFYEFDGTKHVISAYIGDSLMTTAANNDIDGIVAECGGSCACATCHCYVDDAWLDKVGPQSETEDEMLDFAEGERTANSRLSCQITITEALDGLIVRLPEEQ